MNNNTLGGPTSKTGIVNGTPTGPDVYWPLVLTIAILGTLLVVVCVAGSIWISCKLLSLREELSFKRPGLSALRPRREFPPASRNNVEMAEIPSPKVAIANPVEIIPNIHAIHQTGASASLGYKNNPVKEDVPRLIPPNTWTPSPPYPSNTKGPTTTMNKPQEKSEYACKACGKGQGDHRDHREYHEGYNTNMCTPCTGLPPMLRVPQKPKRYYSRHGKPAPPLPPNEEYAINKSGRRPHIPVYHAFEEELRSTHKRSAAEEITRNTINTHLTGNDGRRSGMLVMPREMENDADTAPKPVAESVTNYSITNEPMSSSTVSTNKLVDRSTQTETKFRTDVFERYEKFEPESRPSMSWDHLAADPTHMIPKFLPPKTRGYSVPNAAHL